MNMQRRKNDSRGVAAEAVSNDGSTSRKRRGPRTRKKERVPGEPAGSEWMIRFGAMAVFVVITGYFLIVQNEQTQLDHLRSTIIHQKIEPLSREWEEKYAKLEEENETLRREAKNYEVFKEKEKQFEQEKQSAEDEKQKQNKIINQLTGYKIKMKQNIKLMSRTALLEKFGPGPHKIEIKLGFHADFPKNKETDNDTGRIIIEMAPVKEMPHVVYWFLEQVSRKLYDGCSFHRNAGHVIQGGPVPNFLSPPNPNLQKKFRDSGFHSVLFQEYSPNFPHKKYTLGFAGRPGGPDFYFSTADNSRLHGPGGQISYEDPTEADPCFAKVIEGFDVVDRVQLSPVKPGDYKAMVNNVAIVSMTLMKEGRGGDSEDAEKKPQESKKL